MSEVEGILERIRLAKRPIELVSAGNDAAQILAPQEMREVFRALKAARFGDADKRFKGASVTRQHFGQASWRPGAAPRVFANRLIGPSLRLFEGAGERRDKMLLILMSGHGGRVLIPVSVLLDLLPMVPADVAVVVPGDLLSYRCGVPGLGGNLWQTARALEEVLAIGSYRKLAVLGTSGGGFAALRLARMLGAERGVSVGGRFTFDPLRLRELADRKATAFDSLCGCTGSRAEQGTASRLIAAFGSGVAADRSDALLAAQIWPELELWPVEGVDRHDVFLPLYMHRLLPEFLAQVLGEGPARTPAADLGNWVAGWLGRG